MKKIALTFLILVILIMTLSVSVAAIADNDYRNSSMQIKDADSVSEQDFKTVTQILYKIYAPKIAEKGQVTFVMSADWEDETVNAFATREVSTWTVHISGGIARAKGMTKDSLALIVCHEIGHHLGGAPRTFLYDGWPSAEGQADYWAASKCLKNYYEVLQNEEVVINNSFPTKAVKDCNDVYKTLPELKICLRSMKAGLNFADFLSSLPDAKTAVSIDAIDGRQVKGTNTNDYPRPQCRFDTVYQGALCSIGSNVATSDFDAKLGHCNDSSRPGTRPRCWYKP